MTDDDNTWIDPEEMSLTTSTSDLTFDSTEAAMQGSQEISFSVDVKAVSDTVVCPNCTHVNYLLSGPLLTAFTEEPVPCWHCGYPLK